MRMRGGNLNFEKLTIHDTDLIFVETSQSDWLNFDAQRYHERLVNGETHITPSAGLQILFQTLIRSRFKSATRRSVYSGCEIGTSRHRRIP